MSIEKLRYEATFNHNCVVLAENTGVLIVRRRSRKRRRAEDYLPCSHCFAFYATDDLWRHARKCKFREASDDHLDKDKQSKGAISAGQMMVDGARLTRYSLTRDFKETVLAHMYRDEITTIVKSDALILQYGAALYRKLGKYRVKDITQRMRQLAKLLKAINHGRDTALDLCQSITAASFDSILEAAEELSVPLSLKHGVNSFGTPYIGLNLGYSLLKCAHLKKGLAIRKRDHKMSEESDEFIALHKADWTNTISSRCLTSYRLRKVNTVQQLPLTKDLVTLNKYLGCSMKSRLEKLESCYSYANWRNLLELVLCSLIVFNKRRAGEMSKIQLSAYTTRPDWKTGGNEEVMQGLSKLELQLLQRFVC